MKKVCNKKLFLFGFIVAVVIVCSIALQVLYPRLEHSYEEITDIYAVNYVDGDYVKVKVSEEDKKKIYSIIKYSWINIDFMVGDNTGADGPGILIAYSDESIDSWGSDESNHTSFRKYHYDDNWGQTAAWLKSKNY